MNDDGAEQLTIPSRPVAPARRRRWRRRLWLAAIALFLLFEVGIRNVPPDGMTYTTQFHSVVSSSDLARMGISTEPATTTFNDPKQHAIIANWYNALNSGQVIGSPFLEKGCMTLPGYDTYTVTFTWHDVPVQSWSGGPCPDFMLSSGGILNPLWGRAPIHGITGPPDFNPAP